MAVVDLSMIGLTGQQAYADRTLTIAQAEGSLATARHNAATAQKLEFENKLDERQQAVEDLAAQDMSNLMEGRTPRAGSREFATAAGLPAFGTEAGNSGSSAGPALEMAQRLEAAGLMSRAQAFRKQAADILDAEGKAERAESADQGRRLDNLIKGSDLVGRFLGNARSPEEYQFGQQQLQLARESGQFEMSDDQFNQLMSVGYAPDVVDYWATQSMSVKDNATLELNALKEARQAAQGAQNIALRAQGNELRAQAHAERVRHNAFTRKNAGNTTTLIDEAASDNNRDSVRTALLAGPLKGMKYSTPAEKAEIDALSNQIAEDALLFIREIDGLEWTQAQAKAIAEAEATGLFTGASVEEDATLWFDSKTPADIDLANSPLPTNEAGELMVDEMQAGVRYSTPNGNYWFTGEYDAEGMPIMDKKKPKLNQ